MKYSNLAIILSLAFIWPPLLYAGDAPNAKDEQTKESKLNDAAAETTIPGLPIKFSKSKVVEGDAKLTQPSPAVSLPGIPVNVTEVNSKSIASEKGPEKDKFSKGAVLAQDAIEIKAEPGKNIIVNVSSGYLNRFVTPWDNVQVITTTKLAHKEQGSVVYLGPTGTKPVGIYLVDKNSPLSTDAISLTLIPKKIPPVEVRLKVANSQMRSSGNAEKWERDDTYTNRITSLLKGIAIGELPPGYVLTSPVHGDSVYSCGSDSYDITDVMQVVEGSSYRVLISKVTNNKKEILEFNESLCNRPGVRAVALWPSPVIEPSSSSELYVVINKNIEVKVTNKRPSLIK